MSDPHKRRWFHRALGIQPPQGNPALYRTSWGLLAVVSAILLLMYSLML